MPTPENLNIPSEPITYESLLEKRRLESIQEQQLKEAIEFRQNLTTKVTISWLMHFMVTFGVSYFTIFNNDFVNKGYEVRNYTDSEFKIHSACPKYGEMTNIKTNKCETPPIKNLATSMFYLNSYLMALSVAFSIILSEPIYGLYGEKSAKFRIKGIKQRQETPQILDKSNLENTNNPLTNTKKSNSEKDLQKLKLKNYTQLAIASLTPFVGVYLYSCYLDAKKYDPGLTNLNAKEAHYTIKSIPYKIDENDRSKDFYDEVKTYRVNIDGKIQNLRVRASKTETQNFLRISDKAKIEMSCDNSTMKCRYIGVEGKSNGIQKLTVNPKHQARIIPCPGASVEEAIKLSHQNKLEIIALMGTGTTIQVGEKYPETLDVAEKNPNQFPFIRHSLEKNKYYQPAGEVFVRFHNGTDVYTNYPEMIKRDGLIHPVVRDVGYVTYFDQRSMELLDYSRDSYIVRNDKIKALKKDPKVQGFSLTAWNTNFKDNKKGGIYTENLFDPRTVYVFNQKTKKFLGALYFPPIRFRAIQAKVAEIYPGQNAIGVIQDGDKFAGMVNVTKITRQNFQSNNLMQRSIMYNFQAVHCLAVAKENPRLNILDPQLKGDLDEFSKNAEFNDKIADISKYINNELGIKNPFRPR
jgi:hypothetical protein